MTVLISALEGNRQRLDGGAMFGNAPRLMWEKWLSPDEQGRIELACRCMLVECDGVKILCETGIGAFFEPKLAQRYGVQNPDSHRLLESLQHLGLSDSDIDYVILSHLHFDHAGGLLNSFHERKSGEGPRLLFPKAKYVVGQQAYERCKSPHVRDRASFIPELFGLLEASKRLLIVPDRHKHIPGTLENRVSFIYTDGHTPGQMHTLIRSKDSYVFFCGDLIPGAAWIHPPITMGYDRFPEQLIDEKLEIYKQAVPQEWLLFFTHDVGICAAQCQQDDKGKITVSKSYKELTHYKL